MDKPTESNAPADPRHSPPTPMAPPVAPPAPMAPPAPEPRDQTPLAPMTPPAAPPAPMAPAPGATPAGDSGRLLRAAKWISAISGVLLVVLAIQAAVGVVAGIALGVYAEVAGTWMDDEGVMLLIMVAAQVVTIVALWPWWEHERARAFGPRRAAAAPPRPGSTPRTLLALAALGISIQYLLGVALGLILPLFPEVMAEYDALMESAGVGAFSLLSVVSTAVLAPISEEIACRGIMFEYALRVVGPGWNKRTGAAGVAVPARAFWIANGIQALAFAILHLNIVQGAYAFALGLLLGWVYWRTGKLRYPMLLHLAINGSAYIMDPLSPLIDPIPAWLFLPALVLLFAGGIELLKRAWPASDELAPGDGASR